MCRRVFRIVVLISAVLFLATCARRTAGDKNIPLIWISDGPTYDFGTVTTINSVVKPIAVTNAGASTATSLTASISDSSSLNFLGGSYPGTGGTCSDSLPTLSACLIVLAFSPASTGSMSSDLVVSFGDGRRTWNLSRHFTATIEDPAWTWIAGGSGSAAQGVYGTKGTAASTNAPGAREAAVGWSDRNNNLWLFGGWGYHTTPTAQSLNDLWKWDGSNWTWIAGTNSGNQNGVYGTLGTADPANAPGSRYESMSAMDFNGNGYVFGGIGYGQATSGVLNDLWKWNGTQWTWIGGGKISNCDGVYGTKGTAAGTNNPGCRSTSAMTTDITGGIWLLGGTGYDSMGGAGYLNDLWRFDGTNWTWMSGDDTVSQPGVYGTKGVASVSNKMPVRTKILGFFDLSATVRFFGGFGEDTVQNSGDMNDVWKYDGTSWTWIAGSDTVDPAASYGTKGVYASTNTPGGREFACGARDLLGRFWVFGGYGWDASGHQGALDDLWRLDGTQWTWMGGTSGVNGNGTYGIKGTKATSNQPPARIEAVCWMDTQGNFWVFGGVNNGGSIIRNDLWKFGS